MTRRLLAPLAALAVAAVPTTAALAGPAAVVDGPPVDPPSVAQLCAATNIDAIDAYLAAVAESQLAGKLAPLLDLTVPLTGTGVQVEADVSLEQIRDALDCGETPTPTTTPAPTTTAGPTTSPTASSDDDDDDDDDDSDDDGDDSDDDDDDDGCCTQVDVTPRGGVDTGDGSTLIVQ